MTDAYNAGREADLKRHEWKLPAANWLRDEINQVLSRYDIHPDAYEKDIRIDALCVVAVDKITALLDAPAPAGVTVPQPSLSFLRPIWKAHGGEWHGPKVERWSIPETQMTAFFAAALRALSEDTAHD